MIRVSKWLVRIVLSLACLAGLVVFLFSYFSSNELDNRNPAKQNEMMPLILEWGRLAPFPAHASDIKIETEGSSFTRSFQASFVAPSEEIQAWIKNSPGLAETNPEEISKNQFEYTIKPGSGANIAKVTIDYSTNQVLIYVSWG